MQEKKSFEIQDDSFWDVSHLMPKAKQNGAPLSQAATPKQHTTAPQGSTAVPPHTVKKQEALSNTDTKTSTANEHPEEHRVIKNSELPSFSNKPEKSYTLPEGAILSVSIFSWPNQYSFFSGFRKTGLTVLTLPAEKAPCVPFFSFMPQYHQLTSLQLRYYLYFRKSFLEEQYLPADFSYLLLFAYEIINLPDMIPPEKGVVLLSRLWLVYRGQYPKIEKYLSEWLCDYCLIHSVRPPKKIFDALAAHGRQQCSFKEFYISREDNAFQLTGSAYDYKTGKYYIPETEELFDKHIPAAMKRFRDYMERTKTAKNETEPPEIIKISRTSYDGAVCVYSEKKRIDIAYTPYRAFGSVSVITDAVKLCENFVRAACGIRSRLSTPSLTPSMRKEIELYFAENLPSKAVSKEAVEENYLSRYDAESHGFSSEIAHDIEEKSMKVALRLGAVYDEDEDGRKEKTPFFAEVMPDKTPFSLQNTLPNRENPGERSDAEKAKEALTVLIERGNADFTAYAQKLHMLPHSLVEKINEEALFRFGDIAVEERNGAFFAIEDYKEELESWIMN